MVTTKFGVSVQQMETLLNLVGRDWGVTVKLGVITTSICEFTIHESN